MKTKRKFLSLLMTAMVLLTFFTGCTKKEVPEFSDDTMFTLRISQPWYFESLHYTLKSDGTLIVLYYDLELGRETLSNERMNKIKKVFSPEKVYNMNIGKENERTEGDSKYIILYDSNGNEIKIGGYELEGGDHFSSYFDKLYRLCEDDYTKKFSDKLFECAGEQTTFYEKYLNSNYENYDPSIFDE